MASHRPITGWCITTGKQGHEQQALGILESLVDDPVVKRVDPSGFQRFFAPYFRPANDARIAAPWPDIVITSGRQSAAYARMIGQRSQGRTFTAVMQDPKAPPRWFDFLWVNIHDKASGPNVMKTLTAPHRVTPQRLRSEGAILQPRLGDLPPTHIALILGGPNSAYRFSVDDAKSIGEQAARLAQARQASVLVTPSRRTGDDRLAAIVEGLGSTPHWAWDHTGDNPYFGILELSSEIIVTSDSVNMMGEAAATGKPVHLAKLAGKDSKFDRFHQGILDAGAAHWLEEMHDSWTYEPIDAHKAIVTEILRRYDLKMRTLHASDRRSDTQAS